jgi:hypothetical protein
MVTPSGIVLPGDKPLTLRAVGNGMFVAVNAYEFDAGYFGRSPLYGTGSAGGGEATGSNAAPAWSEKPEPLSPQGSEHG